MNSTEHPNHSVHAALGILLPVLLLGAGGALAYFAKKPEPPKVAALGDDPSSLLSVMPAAQVRQVLALTEPLDISSSGVVVPYREIVLAAEVAGRIIEKDPSVRQGNHVHKGQILLKIDSRDYQLEADRLTQRLEQEKVSVGENAQEQANIARLVEVAEAQYALAEADFERTNKLGQNFASQSELGNAKQSVLTAMNQKVTLENQLRTVRTRGQWLERGIRMVETELELSRLNLQRTQIPSPVNGIIVREQVETDSYVQRGTNLITVEDNSKAEVSCSLRMDQLYWILDQASSSHDRSVNASLATLQKLPKIEAVVRFRVAGRQSMVYEWAGRLDRVDGTGLDTQSRMVPVRIVVDKPAEYQVNGQPSSDTSMSLVRGMFVDIVLKAQPATPLLLVPKSSVKPATDSYRIWKFDPDPSALQVVRKRQGFAEPDSKTTPAVAENDKPLPTQVSERKDENTAPLSPTDMGRPDPQDWQAGFLRVKEGIEVLGSYQGTKETEAEYWICDVAGSGVLPGDFVVVTPIPGIDTDEAPIRVSKSDLQTGSIANELTLPSHATNKTNTSSESTRDLQ